MRAAIDAQRAIHELNQKRLAQNASREIENRARLSAGLPPKPLLTALQLGTGINTGLVTVGLMGSETHHFNYTVFGREVNLASRLEGVSGSGRIIISDTTYNHLLPRRSGTGRDVHGNVSGHGQGHPRRRADLRGAVAKAEIVLNFVFLSSSSARDVLK